MKLAPSLLTIAVVSVGAWAWGQNPAPKTTTPSVPRILTPTPSTPLAPTQPKGLPGTTTKIAPKLEAVAETRLIMEGLTNANFKGLERLLTKEPADNQAWVYARGQSLLVAETGNLLMLRPPSQGQALWFERAMDLRSQASQLALALSRKDFQASRAALVQVGESCNRCHQSFRVPVQIAPFEDGPAR